MNLLAHAYLSFDHTAILIGNMIGDFVRGKQYLEYPIEIQKGILLHRQIDNFTDTHPINIATKKIFQPKVRLYASAFLDISYDHFLAIQPGIYSPNEWKTHIHNWYHSIRNDVKNLPIPFQKMFHYMEAEDWLFNYRYPQQIEESFEGLVHRAQYLPNELNVFPVFENNYAYLQQQFQIFFPELRQFVQEYLDKNISS